MSFTSRRTKQTYESCKFQPWPLRVSVHDHGRSQPIDSVGPGLQIFGLITLMLVINQMHSWGERKELKVLVRSMCTSKKSLLTTPCPFPTGSLILLYKFFFPSKAGT